jgi:hypothetical protein
VGPHVWTPPAAHCIAPGEHTPVHAPLTHAASMHTTAVLHCPLSAHDSTLLVPEHSVVLGEHTPAHWPATQAWLAHATAAPHVPSALHVLTPLPEH